MATIHPAILIPFAVVLFALWWCCIVYLLSIVGGWKKLADAYGLPQRRQGQSFSFQAGRIGIVSYKGALQLTLCPEGIVFSVLPLFRPGHNPFLIPWDDITIIGASFWGFVEFRAGPGGKKLMLTKKLFARAWPHLPSGIQKQLQDRAGMHAK